MKCAGKDLEKAGRRGEYAGKRREGGLVGVSEGGLLTNQFCD